MKNFKLFPLLLAATSAALFATGCGQNTDSSQPSPNIVFNAPETSDFVEYSLIPDCENVDSEQFEAAFEVISLRLINMGSDKGRITKDEDGQYFHLRLSAAEANSEVLSYLTSRGDLTFRKGGDSDENGCPTGDILLDSSDVDNAEIVFDDIMMGYIVQVNFNSQGKDKFGKATADLANTSTPLSVWLDGELLCAPLVTMAITDGKTAITGNFSGESAKKLADSINSGCIPFDIMIEK